MIAYLFGLVFASLCAWLFYKNFPEDVPNYSELFWGLVMGAAGAVLMIQNYSKIYDFGKTSIGLPLAVAGLLVGVGCIVLALLSIIKLFGGFSDEQPSENDG